MNDTSRKFWLRAKEVLKQVGLKVMEGDKALYYMHRNGELIVALITHVDDFALAGPDDFVNEILEIVRKK